MEIYKEGNFKSEYTKTLDGTYIQQHGFDVENGCTPEPYAVIHEPVNIIITNDIGESADTFVEICVHPDMGDDSPEHRIGVNYDALVNALCEFSERTEVQR